MLRLSCVFEYTCTYIHTLTWKDAEVHASAHYCFVVINNLQLTRKGTLSRTTVSQKHNQQVSQPAQNMAKLLLKLMSGPSVFCSVCPHSQKTLWITSISAQMSSAEMHLQSIRKAWVKEKTVSFQPAFIVGGFHRRKMFLQDSNTVNCSIINNTKLMKLCLKVLPRPFFQIVSLYLYP